MDTNIDAVRLSIHDIQVDALTLLENARVTIEKTWAVSKTFDRSEMVKTVQLHAELIANMIDMTNWLLRHERLLNESHAVETKESVRLPIAWNFGEERAQALAAQLPDLHSLIGRAEELFKRARRLDDVLHGETVH